MPPISNSSARWHEIAVYVLDNGLHIGVWCRKCGKDILNSSFTVLGLSDINEIAKEHRAATKTPS